MVGEDICFTESFTSLLKSSFLTCEINPHDSTCCSTRKALQICPFDGSKIDPIRISVTDHAVQLAQLVKPAFASVRSFECRFCIDWLA